MIKDGKREGKWILL